MKVEELISDSVAKPLGTYSQGMKVTAPGSLVFISGMTSRDAAGNVVGAGDIKLQTRTALENVQATLRSAGAEMSDVVKLTIYIRDMEQFGDIHDVRTQFFTAPYPACAMLEVSRMVSPESLIEIEAIAVLPAQADA